MKTDFLVIGSGAAGLSFALKAAEHGHVTLVTKGKMDECNTNYAQGGICSVTYAPDTFEKHIHDTLVCGAGKCDPAAVELVVRRAPELIRDLITWGTKFDKTPDGRFELNREGGHTEHRILHHEDLTGAEIERALITSVRKHPNITVLEHHFAIDLLTQHHLGEFVTRHTRGLACFGAYVLNLESNEIETVLAKFTVVAAGGCGNVYSSTTNPSVATGDGIAMCHRAKAITENMEFIQFHPTSLYHPAEKPNFLITEAMRGYGAILRLQNGEEFMDKYHPMKSLAPRDVTARAIYTEMTRRGEDFVYLDVRHKDPEQTRRHFPNIYEKCLSLGIDITRKPFRRVTTALHRRRRSRVPCGDDCFIPKRLFFKTLDERLRRLERRDGMRRHEDGRVARDVAGLLRGSLTAHETAEAPEIDILSAYLGCTNPLQQCLDDTCDHFTLQTRLSGNLLDDLCFCHKCCILMFVIFAKIAIFSSTGNSVSPFFPGCISNSTQE